MAEIRLVSVLGQLEQALKSTHDPWWIIGSAAVALHGGNPGNIADIDVIVSRRDLDTLYAALPLTNTPEEDKAIFRSQRFGRWAEPALDVEFMTGLEVLVDGKWQAVQPQTRVAVQSGETKLFLPEQEELVAILHLFGREKDLARAATLRNI